jgi:hypothetical protein
MDLARYVVEAVVLEGRSYREVARGPRGLEELGREAGRAVPGRWLRVNRAPIEGATEGPAPDAA